MQLSQHSLKTGRASQAGFLFKPILNTQLIVFPQSDPSEAFLAQQQQQL